MFEYIASSLKPGDLSKWGDGFFKYLIILVAHDDKLTWKDATKNIKFDPPTSLEDMKKIVTFFKTFSREYPAIAKDVQLKLDILMTINDEN